ncbi:MAG: hypothetical protein AAF081_00935 [Actinomycetota bacterium]
MRSKTASIPATSDAELAAWFADACPEGWFATTPHIRHDSDEILVTGDLGQPGAGLDHDQQIVAFREATRDQRMEIADRAQTQFQRRVSWGVECGDEQVLFTTVNAPAMTRLRLDERLVLDSLIAGGIARSRSEALAWCVRLVGQHEGDWIAELGEAVEAVKRVRDEGPQA